MNLEEDVGIMIVFAHYNDLASEVGEVIGATIRAHGFDAVIENLASRTQTPLITLLKETIEEFKRIKQNEN